MSPKSILFCGLLALSGFIAACSSSGGAESPSESGNQTFKVYRFQPNANQGVFVSVLLEHLSTIQQLSGKFATFMYAPTRQSGEISGEAPQLHFLQNREGIWIPQNILSAETASLYYEFQNLYYFDKKIGVENLYTLPRKIAVRARVSFGRQRQFTQNNAFYDMKSQIFFFVPSQGESLQIPLNEGIIAHEHFHSLFHQLVLKNMKLSEPARAFLAVHEEASEVQREKNHTNKLSENGRLEDSKENNNEESEQNFQKYNYVFLRGLNEGLADFWGWLQTEDEKFVGKSLPSHLKNRDLSLLPVKKFMDSNLILADVNNYSKSKTTERENLNSLSYVIGTQIARKLVSFSKEIFEKNVSLKSENTESKIQFKLKSKEKIAQGLVKYLKQFGSTLQERLDKSEFLDPENFLVDYGQFLKEQDPDYFNFSFESLSKNEKK